MAAFRILLVVIFATVFIYTIPVTLNHGMNLHAIFFTDILAMGWPGQFNLDFFGMLMFSGFWMAWRQEFTAAGLFIGLLGLNLGAPMLAAYLLVVSFRSNGDPAEMLLGKNRANALRGG
jgi:hypothetical protein